MQVERDDQAEGVAVGGADLAHQGLQSQLLAGAQTVATVDDLAVEDEDGLALAVRGDIGHERGEGDLIHRREQGRGRMRGVGSAHH